MRILEGGLLTTVQDLGRYGYQKIGVTPSGAMDPFSLRVANILVGNPEGAAAQEITLQGPGVEFTSDTLIALTGADASPRISDVDIPMFRAVAVRRGSILTFGRATSGCRVYLAVAGGIDVPVVMGSRSTHLRAHIGGYEGRSLRTGDDLSIGTPTSIATATMAKAISDGGPMPFSLSDRYLEMDDPRSALPRRPIRCVRGPHFDAFSEADKRSFLGAPFEVSTDADRMGYRIAGPRLSSVQDESLISSAVTTGAIQVPPGGEPIVLMADRQTTGGYPIVAQVITADLRFVAQMRPGDELTFAEVGISEAHEALRAMHRSLAEIRRDIETRVSS